MRLVLRCLLLLPVVVLLAQLCGLVYLPALALAEHAVLEPLLFYGWSVDEWLRARPVWQLALLLVVGGAGSAALLGIVGPLEPAIGREPGRVGLELARAPVGVAVTLVLGTMFLFGVAVAPALAVLLVAGSALVRPPDEPVRPRSTLTGVLVVAVGSLVFVASMLATPRDGTLWDSATSLMGSWVAWIPVVGGLAAAQLLAGRWGMPLLPDLTQWPGRWPWETGRLALIAATAIAWNAGSVVRCPDADMAGVRRLSDDRAAFDVDVDERGVLTVVHREEAWVRIYSLAGDGPAQLRHELGPRMDGDLEEVFTLPGGHGFLVTEILDEAPKTLLLRVDPETGDVTEGNFDGMCWVSSMAWHEQKGEVLLGCETEADVWALNPATWTVRHVGRLDAPDDSEDIAVTPDGEAMFMVSLAEGDQLRKVNPQDAGTLASRGIGGFNYSVVFDEVRGDVIVARFHDSQLVSFDPETLDVRARRRVGFGVRSVVPSKYGYVVGSQFGGRLKLVRGKKLKVARSYALGGRVKGFAVSADGEFAYASTMCGTFEVNLFDEE